MPNNQVPRIIFRCDYCGNWSSQPPSHYNKKKLHFCETDCYSSYRREILPKEKQHAYKNGGLPDDEKRRRAKARSIVNHAIRDKELFRPLLCEMYAFDETGCRHPIEAHHDDYSKPLDVKWLCKKHHWQIHTRVYENKELIS